MMKTNGNDRPEERPNDAQKPSDSDSLVTYGGPGSGPPEPYWENLLKSAAKQPPNLNTAGIAEAAAEWEEH
jgi:hypothetical protein